MTLPSDIQRIKELLATATPGPWKEMPGSSTVGLVTLGPDDIGVCAAWSAKRPECESNAELIRLLRNTIESLLDERERHAGALKLAKEDIIRFKDTNRMRLYPTLESIDKALSDESGKGEA